MTTRLLPNGRTVMQVSDNPPIDPEISKIPPSQIPENRSIVYGYFVSSVRQKKKYEECNGKPLTGELPEYYADIPIHILEPEDGVTALDEAKLLDHGWLVRTVSYGLMSQQIDVNLGLKFVVGMPEYKLGHGAECFVVTCKEGHHVVLGMDWNECWFLSKNGNDATEILTSSELWLEMKNDPGRRRRNEKERDYSALEAQIAASYEAREDRNLSGDKSAYESDDKFAHLDQSNWL
ncbi:hypothetical protein BJ508DRAFT_361708 [Ascobolus immersus RN42]|uniref:Uncharacterized protein n=1 Tax=Ascobolus immersus RN42 TaxID=1160509 RepID=A0A3N4IBY7_ASCIM|nr:hypothetical protein BJ508DRAFT_361708 [Ascobolus immersus RN42]